MLKKLTLASLILTISGTCQAAQPKLLGQHGQWSAYELKEDNKKVCYMVSKPTKQEGNAKKRGPAYAMITHRPAAKSFNVVSFHAGYPYAAGAFVNVTISKDKYKLFTDKDTAWTNNETDGAMVNSIKKGESIVLVGKSNKGAETTDTYSLKGSTQAYQEISKACGLE